MLREPEHTLYQPLKKNNCFYALQPSCSSFNHRLVESTFRRYAVGNLYIRKCSYVHCYCDTGEVEKQNSRRAELLRFHATFDSKKPRVLMMLLGHQRTAKETPKRSLGISTETRSCFPSLPWSPPPNASREGGSAPRPQISLSEAGVGAAGAKPKVNEVISTT